MGPSGISKLCYWCGVHCRVVATTTSGDDSAGNSSSAADSVWPSRLCHLLAVRPWVPASLSLRSSSGNGE